MQLDIIHHGDCLELMRTLPDACVDAVVTDPPYGLSFMGKAWDYDVPGVTVWRECLRALKPGGHLLSFFGTRTYHRGVVPIEDAGFEIRDQLAWVYGSGFPKSMDVSKAIDKQAGAEREVVGALRTNTRMQGGNYAGEKPDSKGGVVNITAPATEEAKRWQGWGTALKPAWEPIVLARKRLCGNVAENVLAHGTGAINIDGCRVDGETRTNPPAHNIDGSGWGMRPNTPPREVSGRFPANLIHDGSAEVVEIFPVELGRSAARFFYCAKAQAYDREAGISEANFRRYGDGIGQGPNLTRQGNNHPTVKPIDLMRWLVRLIAPPGGIVLDPFGGSGSTGKAAILEGLHYILCEREAEYCDIARARIAWAERERAKMEVGARFDRQGIEVARQMKLGIV
jgi:site-specific DNA-methyltransferase (adenine-specific)